MGEERRLVNRRPLFFAALLLGAGIFFACFLRLPFMVFASAFLACCVISLAFYLFFRKLPERINGENKKPAKAHKRGKARTFSALTAYASVFFLGAFLISLKLAFPVLDVTRQKEFTFAARVCETPVKTDFGYTHILSGASVWLNGKTQRLPGNIRFVSEKEYPYGSLLKITAPLKLPKGAVNPGGYDERLNLNRRGIYYKAYADTAAVLGRSPPDPYGWMLHLKQGIKDVVHGLFPGDVRGLALGMLLGDTQELSEETYGDFKTAGASHILAVSGLNVAIIIYIFYRFLKLLRIGKKPRYFATLLFIAFYAVLTGLGPSIVRASVMAVLFLTTGFFGQKTDPLIVLSASFLFILLLNPLELFMPGFALTFGAVFGMVTLGDAISRRLKKWPKFARELISANIGATAGTAPILLSRFYSVSLVSVFGNLAIVPLSTAATIIITVVVPLAAIWKGLAWLPAMAATSLMRMINGIVSLLAKVPFASVTLGALHAGLLLTVLVWLFAASRYLLVKPAVKKTVVVVFAVLIMAVSLFSYIPWKQDLYVAFLDVGQGDSAFVRSPDGVKFLVDGGDAWAEDDIASFLDYKGYTLDFVFLTHPHDDHMGGLAELLNKGRVKTVYTTQYVYDTQKEALRNADVRVLEKGDTVSLKDGLSIAVLHPSADTPVRYPNNTSLVLLLRYKGHSLLLTGDISAVTDKQLLDDIGKTDIIKVAHHGADSSTSEALLEKAHPDYAVISVGGNSYGQPGREVLARLARFCRHVYRTDKNHAVEFEIGGTVRALPMYP